MTIEPLRFSALKHMARSPAHVRHYLDNGRDDKPWLRGGRGLHAVLFGTPYVVFDGASRASKEWKEFLARRERIAQTLSVELEATADSIYQDLPYRRELLTFDPSAEIILAKELPIYRCMADSILSELYRQGMTWLLDGEIEKRIEWEWLGRTCGGTPDVASGRSVTDVKTTACADPKRFHWDARKFGYAEQVVWYANGAKLSKADLFVIAVEKTAPYPAVIWQVTDRMREQAERTVRLWMEQFLACESSDVWPGYTQTVQQLDVLDDGLTLTIGEDEVDGE